MTPQEASKKIRAAILRRPELRYNQWPDVTAEQVSAKLHPYLGHCNIATQVFCHVIPEAVPYCCGRHHFWAKIDEKIWDLTKDQFEHGYDYTPGYKTRFEGLCNRAQALYEEAFGEERVQAAG